MNVFVLTTGRSGSAAFINACKFITNYTCGHESNACKINEEKFNYPENHIEADNRLAWFLGDLDLRFQEKVFYVHLIRNKEKTVSSLKKRILSNTSIIRSFASGILKNPYYTLSKREITEVTNLYYSTVNQNIEFFLKDKSNFMTIQLKSIDQEFEKFWQSIGAKGDLEGALKSFNKPVNTSKKNLNILFNLKSFVLRQLFHLKNI